MVAGYAYKNARDAATTMYTPVSKSTSSNKNRSSLDKILAAKKPVNLLILGTDTGAEGRSTKKYQGLTDLMMFVTVNPSTKKTRITTIARDSKVNLPDYPQYSPIKLNSAYSLGGVSESIKTLDKYYSVPIDGYVLVNWKSTMKIITKMGGVDVVSPLTFTNMGYSFKKGQTYHISGKKALAFVQLRHGDPRQDYGRQDRERRVMVAALKKSVSYQTILNSSFMQSLGDSMQTDLTLNNMTSLAMNYRGATSSVKSDYAQGTSSSVNNQKFGNMEVEVMSTKERQRISDNIRETLGIKKVNVYKEDN
ncbi:transcriptional regulator [Lactobacillus nasalidis]|uniref:Transcriptional regulator n=2 Tax=Lactobacillus nasalidis TaxID=2797258 RepID=A0ABQ3W6L3_9LACO|nr:transcriptional regulator [Lactobacillus nasalidis]GHV99680.1 transcriptional regulator [Lactobacillus nasalidis]GHW00975.1 transcriptional regulator [Lactobacillus nasalidis]